MIRLSGVSKRFGGRLAVDGLNLAVPEGQIYGLLGHNGAGKSTAIGMMLGQVWPTAGEVRVCGFDVQAERRRALRHVGALFESPAFYDYLSGWRNLEILSDCSARTPAWRIREVVDWVGLTGREHSKVRTYSHGMRSRLALAQALLPNPKLLILDEPSDGLDPEGIHEMRMTILRLHRELRITILLSSHFLSEVEQMCARIAVLNQGRLVFEGELGETRHRGQWLRLGVGSFEFAVRELQSAGLVAEAREGRLVRLNDGQEAAAIVRLLVDRGISVHEIGPAEESLEQFYLSLMKRQKNGETAEV